MTKETDIVITREERRHTDSVTLQAGTLLVAKVIVTVLATVMAAGILGGVTLAAQIRADLQLVTHQIADIRQWREGVDVRLGAGGFSARDGDALRALVQANADAGKAGDAAIVRQLEQLAAITERLAGRLDAHVASDGHSVALQKTAEVIRRVEELERRAKR